MQEISFKPGCLTLEGLVISTHCFIAMTGNGEYQSLPAAQAAAETLICSSIRDVSVGIVRVGVPVAVQARVVDYRVKNGRIGGFHEVGDELLADVTFGIVVLVVELQ